MGSATLDALTGWREIPGGLDGPHGGRMAASYTLRMKRLVSLWIAVAVSLLISIGGSAAQPQSGEPAAQPKRIVVLYSYGQHFQAWAHMEQGHPQ